MTNKKYIASVSFGKDSTAMLLLLIQKQYPLDEVMFYDTGMEFQAIYNLRNKLVPILNQKGIKYTELKPESPFLYDMLERPVTSKQKGQHNGYGWCGGLCRWGTSNKTKALDKHAKEQNAIVYIGLAKDEPERLERLQKCPYKTAPLADWDITEKQALQYCFDHGIHWQENGIELYSILDRVSCWCCCNKNQKELYNIWKHMPEYWQKLTDLQHRTDRPMKKFRTDPEFGNLGNILNLEKYWAKQQTIKNEYEQQSLFS